MPLIPSGDAATSLTAAAHRRDPMPQSVVDDAARPVWPPESAGTVPLEEVLAGRRSVREIADRPVPGADLQHLLTIAAESQRCQWPDPLHGDAGLVMLAACRRVGGLASGLYARGPDGALRPAGNPDWLAELPHRYATAPVIVAIGGQVGRAGTAAYGGLLVRAGALGYAVWLAARTYRLESTVFATTYHPITGAIRRLSPHSRHLFTVAIGYPRAPAVSGED